MATFLSNAFSLNMLQSNDCTVRVHPLGNPAGLLLSGDFVSAIGHPDLAEVAASHLAADGLSVSGEMLYNRRTVGLCSGDRLVVCQYRGPRLPEGAKVLPEGATFEWLLVSIL